ncbi:proton pump-interactor 1-like [Andrographis paniculata]|uniref:proton pump-interactor 1-like n=1 Tax=Andrographis paniculata TaxID=175694 RepID=UPI0021E93F8A|nr:proton pump-interactor 1-like [Andrographis paniculata]
MGVEIVESNLPVVETKIEENMSGDSEKVNITFGSHVVEPFNGEANKVSDHNLPKDAVDEWPEPQQIHPFHIVRYRVLEDQSLKAKLDLADKELQKKNQARLQIVEKLKSKRAARSQVISQIRLLSAENKQFRTLMDEKRKEMEPLQQALGKLRGSSGGRDRGPGVCSSEEELNSVIKSLQYRIQHESIPLSEEKQILREIKQLEGTREKVNANAAERARIQAAMGETDAIQGQVKLIGVDLDEARKEKQVVNAKLKQLDEEKLAIEKEIDALEEELASVTQKRDKTFETIKDMRKQREEGNSPFYQNRMLLTKAKSLAANKEVDALKELAEAEVEKFMSLWNSNKAFRDDYERRILPSLDMRQLSRDGRLRNPGEKPLVETSTLSEVEAVKAVTKQNPQEDVLAPTPVDISSDQKVEKTKSAKNSKDGNKKKEAALEKHEPVEEEEYFSNDKETLPKKEEVDEEKLKQLKREEEIAKRKQAEERKKKLAEKAAAKAAIKAQKEAEKKLKEREKRAKKKAGVTDARADSEEPTEDAAVAAAAEVTEQQPAEDKIETPLPQKPKDRKERATVRHRGRPRGTDSLPKVMLKRKKMTNYWMWGAYAAGAAVVILLLAVAGYRYLS